MSTPTSDSAAIRQVIRALKAADHKLVSVFDGEEDIPVSTETEALEAITAVDEAWLYVALPDGELSSIFFVLGNDPEEVVCNHSVSLSPVLDPLTESWWA